MDNGTFAFKRQFEQLYTDHHAWLCSLLRRKLGNSVDAADLAHDVYVQLMKKGHVPSADESRCHLTQIARGLVIDLYRRRHVENGHRETLVQQSEPLVPCEESRALVVEALGQVEAVLHSQPPKAREAVLLCKLQGIGYRDIAAELQVSVSSVEKYIAAGLKACRQVVSGQPCNAASPAGGENSCLAD